MSAKAFPEAAFAFETLISGNHIGTGMKGPKFKLMLLQHASSAQHQGYKEQAEATPLISISRPRLRTLGRFGLPAESRGAGRQAFPPRRLAGRAQQIGPCLGKWNATTHGLAGVCEMANRFGRPDGSFRMVSLPSLCVLSGRPKFMCTTGSTYLRLNNDRWTH